MQVVSGKAATNKEVKPVAVALRVLSGSRIPRLDSRASVALTGYSSRNLPLSVEDIDAGDSHNVFLSPEYVNDIYNYLRKLEVSGD